MAHIYVSDNQNDQIVVFDSGTDDDGRATKIRAFDAPANVLRGLQGIKVGATNCYCIDWPSKNLVIFPKNIADDGQPTTQQTSKFRFPSDVNNPIAIAIDEANNRGYVADGSTSKIHVFALNTTADTTATEIKTILNPAHINATVFVGLTIDTDGILYAISNNDDTFHAFPAATTDGTAPSGDDLRQFTAPSDIDMPQGLDVLGDDLYCLDVGGFVVTLAKNTEDDATATKKKKFNLPTEAGTSTGLGIDPPPSLTFADSTVRNGRTVRATLTADSAKTGVTLADFSVDVGEVANLRVVTAGREWTVDVKAPATGTGNITLTFQANGFTEGNAEATVTIAHKPLPTFALTYSQNPTRGGRRATVTVTASEDVNGMAASDWTATVPTTFTNLPILNFEEVSKTEYTFDVDVPAGAGNLQFFLAKDSVDEGNASLTVNRAFVALPTVTLTFALSKAISEVAVSATATYSEDVTDIALDDFSVDLGTVANFNKVSNRVYTVNVTPPAGTNTVTLTLAEDAAAEGNAETTAEIDAEPFTLAFANVPTGTVNNRFTCELRASHPISGLDKNDILLNRVSGSDSQSAVIGLNNAQLTLTPIQDTNNYRLTLNLTGTYDGTYRMRMRISSVMSGGQAYPKALLLSSNFQIDSSHDPRIVPTLTLPATGFSGQEVTVNISMPVSATGVTLSHLSTDAGTLSNLQEVTPGRAWTATLTLPRGTGTATVTLAAGATNPLNAEASAAIDYAPVPVTLTATPTNGEPGDEVSIAAAFGAAVAGLKLSGFSTDAGTLSDVQGSGRNWTVKLTLPSSGSGTAVVRLAANATRPFNAEASVRIPYTAPAPPPPVQPVPTRPNAPAAVSVDLTPTTALITWKVPTNGASLTGYEISYAEGASPGTTWIRRGASQHDSL